MEKSAVKYLHYRTFDQTGQPSAIGGATVAYVEFPESNTVRAALALCRDARYAAAKGKSDNFCRRIGRDIARGRLLKEVKTDTFMGDRLAFEADMDMFMARTYGFYRRRKGTVIVQVDVPASEVVL